MNRFPFIFWGAGEATYFEWGEVIVRFKTKPSAKQIKSIIEKAPSPIRPEKYNFHNQMLVAGSGQFINMEIEESYGDISNIDFEGRFHFPKIATLKKFNDDIERWLREVHEVVPIDFVFRGEDCESNGTQFNKWHAESIRQLQPFIENVLNDENYYSMIEKEKELFQHAFGGALDYGNVSELPEKLLMNFFPDVYLSQLLENRKHQDVFDFVDSPLVNEDSLSFALNQYFSNLLKNDKRDSSEYITYLGHSGIVEFYRMDYTKLIGLIELGFNLWDQELLGLIANYCYHKPNLACNMVNEIGKLAYKYQSIDFKKSIDMYNFALEIETPRECDLKKIYCNALWVLQKDNTGLEVNKELNRDFLSKCLPYGPKNPAIYFNAVCLYVEMDEFDHALKMVKLAKKHNYNNYDYMISEIKNYIGFKDFRNQPEVKKLLESI